MNQVKAEDNDKNNRFNGRVGEAGVLRRSYQCPRQMLENRWQRSELRLKLQLGPPTSAPEVEVSCYLQLFLRQGSVSRAVGSNSLRRTMEDRDETLLVFEG